MSIDYSNSQSKVNALVSSINDAVLHNALRVGDNLLSINEASKKYKVSRDTVFKAYNELKRLGVIDSTPQKGYFVKSELNRVLLLLDTYSSFKKGLYQRFVENLPDNFKVDLIFHQYNESLFESILRDSIGKYSMYVVMNFSNEKLSETLKSIPANKLLLLDFGNFDKNGISFICQNFDNALYNCLLEGVDVLRKYQKISFVFPEDLRHPVSSIDSLEKFCKDYGFAFELIRKRSEWKSIEKSCVYLCILMEDLVKVIKGVENSNLELGVDVGLLVYNDDPVLEVIKNGISSISIDFGLMGKKAAEFVKSKELIQEYLPTRLIIRGSV